MPDLWWFFVAIMLQLAVSILGGAVLILLGGYGGYTRLIKAVRGCLDEIERVEARLEREVKARASSTRFDKEDDQFQALVEEAKRSRKKTPQEDQGRAGILPSPEDRQALVRARHGG